MLNLASSLEAKHKIEFTDLVTGQDRLSKDEPTKQISETLIADDKIINIPLYFIEYIDKFVPWIALALLSFLGIKMIIDGIKEIKEGNKDDEVTPCESCLSTKVLLVQAVATSIDALSAGLSFSNYNIYEALIVVGFITVLTTIICIAGVYIGKKFGTKLSKYAAFIGGSILIIIGLEIFLTGILA